jgi:hypothetical protein
MRPTSRTRKAHAVKEEATQLWSKIIRETRGPLCEARWHFPETCHGMAQDAAHIVPRTPAHTRTDLGNGVALCKSCHGRFGLYLSQWTTFVANTMGEDYLYEMEQKANAGVKVKFDWYDELDRLRAIAEELGVAA